MIGIFDSGAGGLSVFKEIRKILPDHHYIYYSDSAHCPYGEKTRDYIITRARTITDFLIDKGAEIIVVACNTATAAAISTLRKEYPHIPFIGMEPAVKPAAMQTRTGIIGVLATAGTLKAEKYIGTKDRFAPDAEVVEHTGDGFVELVEQGCISGEEAENTVRKSISPLIEAGADTIVLGCTHYPFLTEVIKKVAEEIKPGHSINIIDPAPAVARHLLTVMAERGIAANSPEGFNIELHTSGDIEKLKSLYGKLK
ncbi:MAG: glutamate racemase [Bacteroidales bacterium]|nr:glutamate racemase [Bacteroidales bacterium]